MPARSSNGRFISKNNENPDEGFIQEIRGFLRIAYRFWRYVPLFILFFILWRFLGIGSRLSDLRVEICGCTTDSILTNGGESSKTKDNTFSK